jgi:hypothetical protein
MPQRTPTRPRSLRTVAALAGAVAVLVLPASAQAITVSGSVAPTNPAAGANSDVNIHMDFGDGQVKDLTVGLPPGLVGNPNATPLCTAAQLNADACAANTQVGSVSANATLHVLAPLVNVPVTVNGELYNLQANAGEPARFGVVLHALPLPPPLDDLVVPPIILQSGVSLRGDFGLDTIINNIPNQTAGLSTTINSQDITLFGSRAWMSAPFMRNPTSCTEKTATFTAVPYSGAADTATATYDPPDPSCAALDFSPEFSATVGGAGMTNQGALTSVATAIDQGPTEAGLRRAEVLTPVDFGANIDRIDDVCQPADFQAGACPAASVVGYAIATSPLLASALTGPVVLIDTDELPLVGLDLRGQLNLKLTGTLAIDNRVTFDGLPDIPISHFELRFSGGPAGLLFANRDLCAPPPPRFTGLFQSHAGEDRAFAQDALVQGCGQAAAPAKGETAKKCKKAKKRKKARKGEAAAAKKKGKKRCKKRRKKRAKR